MFSLKLQAEVAKVAKERYQLETADVELSVTRELAHGDYTTNVALRVASKWGVIPHQAAEEIVEALQESNFIKKNISKVEIAGPGFINFWVKHEVLWQKLGKLADKKEYNVLKDKKVIIDYSSPNIAKPMHIGHIRSTIIGQALVNLYRALGAKVISINHLGDWGTQFGKLIAAYKMWGNKQSVHKSPIDELLKLYVRFHEEMKQNPELEKQGQDEFRKLEEGDRQNRALWNWFKAESWREFEHTYKKLNIKFDKVTGESFYENMLSKVVVDLLKRRIAKKNADGSVVVHLENETLAPCLLQKSDGASLYATRDVATIKYRVQHYKPTNILYVVGNEQALHFDQVYAVSRRAGYATSGVKLEHIKFGTILGEDGSKMATREGKIIKLEDVLNEAITRARQVVEAKNVKLTDKLKNQVAEVVGMGAMKYNDLSQNRHTDITFNWDKMLSLDGNSAPYLQYTYVRLRSIWRRVTSEKNFKLPKLDSNIMSAAKETDINMLRLLTRYHEALLKAAKDNGPHLLAQYLYELANSINSYYQSSPVINAGNNLKVVRLHLVKSAAEVLKEGLAVLGIGVVEQM